MLGPSLGSAHHLYQTANKRRAADAGHDAAPNLTPPCVAHVASEFSQLPSLHMTLNHPGLDGQYNRNCWGPQNVQSRSGPQPCLFVQVSPSAQLLGLQGAVDITVVVTNGAGAGPC